MLPGSIVTDDSYLEDLLARFLGNAESPGPVDPGYPSPPAPGLLTPALATARAVSSALEASRKLTWRAVYGPLVPFDFPPPPKRAAPVKRHPPRRTTPFLESWIRPCDPARDRTAKHDVFGFVFEVRTGRKLSTRWIPGTTEYATLSTELKGDHLNEVTVVDADLVGYRVRVPAQEIPVGPGALVRARILRKETGGSPWYLCTRLWLLEVGEVDRRRAAMRPPSAISSRVPLA